MARKRRVKKTKSPLELALASARKNPVGTRLQGTATQGGEGSGQLSVISPKPPSGKRPTSAGPRQVQGDYVRKSTAQWLKSPDLQIKAGAPPKQKKLKKYPLEKNVSGIIGEY